ncbi:MAG: hypothetical protein KatS3mg110_3044 [Pirellulaceae bacterium]|nr:MAG: hypothetical protein KatS3mg110_3044 [Pirellulaceae bacterium]
MIATTPKVCRWASTDRLRSVSIQRHRFGLWTRWSVLLACLGFASLQPAAAQSQATSPASGQPASLGRQLYLRHCAGCHGEQGDGQGVAAPQLYPRPRDFRTGKFRLVSTTNNVPTRADLHSVLTRGMPGSAMLPWPQLTEREREAVIDEVLRLRREGVQDQYVRLLKEQEGLTDQEIAQPEIQAEIQQVVQQATLPAEPTPVPELGVPSPEAIHRGRQVYAQFGCVPCHGEQGKGDGIQKMLDDDQLPTRPRDFTAGIFKGADDPASIYRRIAYGMPGTPMPGSSQMTPAQMADLVHYILSLSTAEQRQRVVLNRQTIDVPRVQTLPADLAAVDWNNAPQYTIRLTPLWWRDDHIQEVRVQMLHDGKQIAVHVAWNDPSEDRSAARHEAFADALALEWYVGPQEPFLGMGSAADPVDVWFWSAARDAMRLEQVYPRTVVDVVPFAEQVAASAEGTRPALATDRQPAITLPAQAAGNRVVPGNPVGEQSGLEAGGPGTLTFRLRPNRLVQASAQWQGDVWHVWFRRSLLVSEPDEGRAFRAGERIVVAFAVWDGRHADRNGQKCVSLWQPVVVQ